MDLTRLAESLRALALGYPESYEETPWGERVVKVRGKIFFTCGVHQGRLHASLKLPRSGRALLQRPYAEPTHYGMGRHGWVTLRIARAEEVPVAELRGWIDESFRAVAPKKLSAASRAPSAIRRPPSARKAQKKAKGRAILVCADALRAKRAVEALGARGVTLDVVARAEEVKLARTRAVIVDIGRNPAAGIALAERIDASDRPVHLFIAGVRDASQARRLRALGSAETFRRPPGDGQVAAAVAARLTEGAAARRAPARPPRTPRPS